MIKKNLNNWIIKILFISENNLRILFRRGCFDYNKYFKPNLLFFYSDLYLSIVFLWVSK